MIRDLRVQQSAENEIQSAGSGEGGVAQNEIKIMTSDGINKADWDIIQNYAARIAAAICNDQEGVSIDLTERLLKSLSQLEAKYGRLPSIVATEADYTHDQASRVKLLEEAFLLATEREDTSNQALSASSLAETFLEEMPDLHAAERWRDE